MNELFVLKKLCLFTPESNFTQFFKTKSSKIKLPNKKNDDIFFCYQNQWQTIIPYCVYSFRSKKAKKLVNKVLLYSFISHSDADYYHFLLSLKTPNTFSF
jgi:hypothetical protein